MSERRDLEANICSRLRHLIKSKQLSVAEVERRAGWTQGYLADVLGGRKRLRVEHIDAVLEVLSVNPRDFFLAVFSPPGDKPSKEMLGKQLAGELTYGEMYDLLAAAVGAAMLQKESDTDN